MGHVHLSAGTQAGRHAVKTQALDALGRVAVVEDARQHSNKQIAIRFTVAPDRTGALRRALAELSRQVGRARLGKAHG